MNRRQFAKVISVYFCGISALRNSAEVVAQKNQFAASLGAVEKSLGARLGVAVIDAHTRRQWTYNAEQRFPMCSTFKVLAVAALLVKVDKGVESLARKVTITQSDLVSYSPITEKHVGDNSMSLAQLCAAALTYSDNTAGNKLLESIGGPTGLTQFSRSIGDNVTRLDRWETDLNEASVGDERDTSSPLAIANDLSRLLLGDVLSSGSKKQLTQWMLANTTGDAKLRAGLDNDWVVADKTGGGNNGSMADIAIIWPASRKPILVAVYMTETNAAFEARNAAIAQVAREISMLGFA